MTIIYFILLLTVIICIHELGHLLAAKLFCVYCYEFSFGMGPVLLKKKGKETQYSLRALPIGGFVAMAGENSEEVEAYADVEVADDRKLTNKPWWQKVIIMLAGVTMNFLLAFLIFAMVMLNYGEVQLSPKAIVGEIVENSPAAKAGFEVGDVILKITQEDGRSIEPSSFSDMQTFGIGYEGKEVYLVERDGQQISLEVQPELDEESGLYLIGIRSGEPEVVKVNFLNCWKYGFLHMVDMMKTMFTTLGTLFRGRGLNQLSGPVGIYQAAGTYAAMGFSVFLQLMAMLSVNVGIFNLLPLPVLDGGQVVITLVEAITRHKISDKIKTAVMAACWVLLIALMLYVTWNDISKIIFGG